MHTATILNIIIATLAATSSVVKAVPLPVTSEKVSAAWYAGWHAESIPGFPLSDISWEKYTHMTFAFAIPALDGRLNLDDSYANILLEFVERAHRNGVKALVSIGGSTGSQYWSNNVQSEDQRSAFVRSVIDFAQDHNLDGVDLDWEMPGFQFEGGTNTVLPQDTANYLEFLRLLREDPIGSKDGNPSTDVSGFAQYLDWIAIMNYDVYGSWSPVVGPNAPLDDTCASEELQAGSAVSAVRQWAEAGMPYDKIVLGVASYGRSYRISEEDAYRDRANNLLSRYPRFEGTAMGDAWGGEEGIVDYWALVTQGYVNEDGSPKEGMGHRHDLCTQTPYVYDPATSVMISYDDPRSFSAKGSFIKSSGLRGFAVWEAGGDYEDRLLDSIRGAVGF
ncbi:glycoside hydrolase superfamily [Cyathus striatus]|nr:glycoside hydrolase superfamily [Cyathus striatus]